MNKNEKNIMIECIREVKNQNFGQSWLLFKYFIETYLMSLIIFGSENEITKDCLNLWIEYKKIEKEEQKIHKFLVKYSEKIDVDKCYELLDLLETLNGQTIIYYLNALSDIETACDTRNEIYAKHFKRKFKTLIETEKYQLEAAGLTITPSEIKKFLNYPEDFWKFVKTKITYIDSTKEGNELFYSTLMKFDADERLIDIKVLIPYIIDLKTALVNIHELKHAYDLYQLIGKKVDENNPIYEESAIQKELEFQNQYVLKKFQ